MFGPHQTNVPPKTRADVQVEDFITNYMKQSGATRDQFAVGSVDENPVKPLPCTATISGTAKEPTASAITASTAVVKLPRNLSRKELTYMLTAVERKAIQRYLREYPESGTEEQKDRWATAQDAWQLFMNGDPVERDLIVPDIHPTIPVFLLLLKFFEARKLLVVGRAQELFDA